MAAVFGMDGRAVVIAGGGPTGLTLAGELALAGVDVLIVERRESQELVGSRALGLHARTIEVLDQRGIAERFLAEGYTAQVAGFAGVKLDIGDFPTRHPYGLALVQKHTERILADWVEELGVPILRGRVVTGFAQDEAGVEVALDDGRVLRAQYLVGCDGGRSVVRKAARIAFAGWDPTISHLIAQVEMAGEPQWGFHNDAVGKHAISRLTADGPVGVMLTEPDVGEKDEPTLDDLRKGLIRVYGTDFGVHSPISISRFTDMSRQAERYREGRVLLAGDAAHIHYPVGGHGLNLGVQDAVNLGWKLAQVVTGISSAELLDSYHAERYPVAARVLTETMASAAISRTDERSRALRELVAEMLGLEQARKYMAGRMSELDIRYDFGEGHPLLGRRMPDIEVMTAEGPVRAFTLLHRARPVLLDLGGLDGFDATPWAERVQVVAARYGGDWELPVIGAVAAPGSVLVRPDGHVAWTGRDPAGLNEALTRWFGR
ncbi:2-polyprenyl-6-methoxyphenol hydroxylase and relat ed FAD-dependent oxidoreductases [Devosia sp. DBB001]|nr:2-polyprenyl-6-methoxyphenol hydroxylase and relat ed FAD-dependent oxidoreductases [Devosia sp. DBB001]